MLECRCNYCGKEWTQSPLLYSPDTTRCDVCGSSGEFFIKVRKRKAKVDYYAEDGGKAQEAQDNDGFPWFSED